MPKKSSRAFRTISEASEELDLKPHVLRFWEAKFPDLRPITRGGGRRFYRPEDIDFLRGLRILLHDEKHKIKDVQKLIKVKGPQRVVSLGNASHETKPSRPIEERDLVPERITQSVPETNVTPIAPVIAAPRRAASEPERSVTPVIVPKSEPIEASPVLSGADRAELELALDKLQKLKSRWSAFTQAKAS